MKTERRNLFYAAAMNGELKACPFCGQSKHDSVRGPYVNATGESFVVVCGKCGASSDYYSRTGSAIEAWNTRAVPTPAPGALPELPSCAGTFHVQQFRDCPSMRNVEFSEATDFSQGSHTLYTASQMHAYARAYAEQCRAGVVVTDAPEWQSIDSAPVDECVLVWRGEELPPLTAYSEDGWWWTIGRQKIVTPSHWMPLPAPPALQSAFVDDEGVKNER